MSLIKGKGSLLLSGPESGRNSDDLQSETASGDPEEGTEI